MVQEVDCKFAKGCAAAKLSLQRIRILLNLEQENYLGEPERGRFLSVVLPAEADMSTVHTGWNREVLWYLLKNKKGNS